LVEKLNTKLLKKIAIVILSEPMTYPPTLNAANILAENGWSVEIFGIKYETTDFVRTNENVNLHYIGNQKKRFGNLFQYIYFYFWIVYKVRKCSVILSYDPMSVGPSFFVSKLMSIKWFYHVHDVLDNPKGWYKLIKFIENKLARYAFNISFPQSDRASFYAKEIGYCKPIDIVFNGPRKNWVDHIDVLDSMKLIKLKHGNIIIYQGGIARNFNFEVMLNAMLNCESSFALCIIGRELENGAIDYYKDLARNFGLINSIYFLDPMDYDCLPGVASLANIGLGKFTKDSKQSVNDYYLMGASNKIAEYLAMSLPILIPRTEINRRFIESFNVGLLCDTEDSMELANVIDMVLLDNNYQIELRHNAHSIFIEKFNFDIQFEKILKKLEDVIK
jgi:glycosyltransferase involved in cell wall biosynthesis